MYWNLMSVPLLCAYRILIHKRRTQLLQSMYITGQIPMAIIKPVSVARRTLEAQPKYTPISLKYTSLCGPPRKTTTHKRAPHSHTHTCSHIFRRGGLRVEYDGAVYSVCSYHWVRYPFHPYYMQHSVSAACHIDMHLTNLPHVCV